MFLPFFFLIIRRTFYIVLTSIAASIGALFFILNNQTIDFSILEQYHTGKASILLDDEGNEWARFQLDRRDPVLFKNIPQHVIYAFIAAEDWSFFEHNGISLKGIIRSTLVNMYHQRIVQGASTITQQLVKLLFFDSRKTFSRKLKEQLYSLLVERQFSKEQILETYLNHVYFGCGIYGIQAASNRFWNKNMEQLSIDEAALLAGIVRSPSRYCPLLCPLSCEKRRNIILRSMHKLEYLNDHDLETSLEKPLTLANTADSICAPHLKETIRITLEEIVGKNALYTDGFIIQTTLNRTLQETAQLIFKEKCQKLQKRMALNIDGGLISIEGKTGAIKALVGGKDYNQSQFNRALQAKRQIGSSIKPLIYAAALEKKLNFFDVEIDEAIEIIQDKKTWSPRNNNMKFNGPITRAYALAHSNNIVTIKTLMQVGTEKVISLAQRCHIQATLHPYPSLALGCVDTNLEEVIGMFNVFAHNGIYTKPYYISWIKNTWGKKIWKHTIVKEQVISNVIADQVAKVLESSIERFRKFFPHEWIETDAICKTGTTNDCRTCWFLGATPELTTGVYIGCDDNQSMGKNVYPVHTAFPIWLAINRSIFTTTSRFSYDLSLKEIVINKFTGQKTSYHDDPDAIPLLVQNVC
jgi:penicillin-binding protein 1A